MDLTERARRLADVDIGLVGNVGMIVVKLDKEYPYMGDVVFRKLSEVIWKVKEFYYKKNQINVPSDKKKIIDLICESKKIDGNIESSELSRYLNDNIVFLNKEKIKRLNLDREMDKEKIKQRLNEKIESAHASMLTEIAYSVFSNDPSILEELGLMSTGKLPTDKPKWRDRNNPNRDSEDVSLTPPEYIKKYYGQYLNGTIGRAELNKPDIDPPLYTALYNWLRKNEMPDDLNLPTASERVETELKNFDGKVSQNISARKFRRLQSASLRRQASL